MIVARRGLKVTLKVRVMGQANGVAPTSIKSGLSLAYLLNFRDVQSSRQMLRFWSMPIGLGLDLLAPASRCKFRQCASSFALRFGLGSSIGLFVYGGNVRKLLIYVAL